MHSRPELLGLWTAEIGNIWSPSEQSEGTLGLSHWPGLIQVHYKLPFVWFNIISVWPSVGPLMAHIFWPSFHPAKKGDTLAWHPLPLWVTSFTPAGRLWGEFLKSEWVARVGWTTFSYAGKHDLSSACWVTGREKIGQTTRSEGARGRESQGSWLGSWECITLHTQGTVSKARNLTRNVIS